MAEEYITRQEHEEFNRRNEEEHARLNKRASILEGNAQRITDLTIEIRELAHSIKDMTTEQTKIGKRLESLEARDGQMWRKVTGYVVTLLVGAVVAFIMAQIGLQ